MLLFLFSVRYTGSLYNKINLTYTEVATEVACTTSVKKSR